jgi:hypothetical protein
MFGLTQTTLDSIHRCLSQYPQIRWVKIYGSRAKGNFKKGSDVDFAFSSDHDMSAELWSALDALPTPYQFDLTHYESLTHPDLKDHIDRVGVNFYPLQ